MKKLYLVLALLVQAFQVGQASAQEATPASEWNGIADVQLFQAETARISGGVGLSVKTPDFLPRADFMLRVGVSEHVTLADGKPAPEHFFSSGLSLGLGSQIGENLEVYSQLTLEADGLGLRSEEGETKTHFVARSVSGLQINGDRTAVYFGAGVQGRALETSELFINGRQFFSGFSVLPVLGFAFAM